MADLRHLQLYIKPVYKFKFNSVFWFILDYKTNGSSFLGKVEVPGKLNQVGPPVQLEIKDLTEFNSMWISKTRNFFRSGNPP